MPGRYETNEQGKREWVEKLGRMKPECNLALYF